MLARLSVLCAGALLLASSSVHAAVLTLSATTMTATGGVFGPLPDGGRTSLLTGTSMARFTVQWDVDPTEGAVIAVSCSDSAGLALSSYLTNPGADLTFNSPATSLGNYLHFPARTTAVNRLTNNLVTCTATLAGYTAGQTTFYVGGILELSNNVPSAVAVPGTSYNLLSSVTPSATMSIFEETEQLTITCGGVGTLNATTQSWTSSNGGDVQTIVWTAPAVPVSTIINCTYSGPTPANPVGSSALFDYYSKTVQFTMVIPTISVSAVVGRLTVGVDQSLTVTLSQPVSGHTAFMTSCTSGGVSFGTAVGSVVITSGQTGTLNLGSEFSRASSAVTCVLAWGVGDQAFAAAASQTIGPFAVIPTIGISSVSGTVQVGLSINAQLTLSQATNGNLTLIPTCTQSGGGAYGTWTQFTILNGSTTGVVNLGSGFDVPATGVVCTVAFVSGDDAFTNAAASNTGVINIVPSITAAAFTGTVVTGFSTPVTITLSQAVASSLTLQPSCTVGIQPYDSMPALEIASGSTGDIQLGASFTTAATGVRCRINYLSGDAAFASSPAPEVGPFNVVNPTISVAPFTGTITTGTNVAFNITLSQPLVATMTLRPSCTQSGGGSYTPASGSFIDIVLVSGVWTTLFDIGADLTAAATAVNCQFAFLTGDAGWTNSAAGVVGPFTVVTPTLSAPVFTGTIATGSSTGFNITLSQPVGSLLILRPSCTQSGGAAYGTFADLTLTSGQSVVLFPIGASLAAAATGVNCQVAFQSGDAGWTNTPAAVFGPFTVVVPTISISAFTGTVVTGVPTVFTVTLSLPVASPLALQPACTSGGNSYSTFYAFTIASGSSITMPIGADLTVAATGVECTLMYAGGDSTFAASPAASVGPFTVANPLITAASFTGIVTAGTNTAVTITLSYAPTSPVTLRPSCTAAGAAYGSAPDVVIAAGTSASSFLIGANLTAAATGVQCSVAFFSGASGFTYSAAATVGPFTVVMPAVASSSTAASDASSSSSSSAGASSSGAASSGGSSGGGGGATSSTGGCGTGGICAAPASLHAGLSTLIAIAAAVIGATMH